MGLNRETTSLTHYDTWGYIRYYSIHLKISFIHNHLFYMFYWDNWVYADSELDSTYIAIPLSCSMIYRYIPSPI